MHSVSYTHLDVYKRQQCTIVILRSYRNRNKDRIIMQNLMILGFTLQTNIPIIALLPQTLLTTTTRNHNTLSKIIPRTIHQQNLPICQTNSRRTISSISYPNGRKTHPLYQNKHRDTFQTKNGDSLKPVHKFENEKLQ